MTPPLAQNLMTFAPWADLKVHCSVLVYEDTRVERHIDAIDGRLLGTVKVYMAIP